MFEVFLAKRAEKSLKALDDRNLRERIEKAIESLSHTYFPRGYDIKKLKGAKTHIV